MPATNVVDTPTISLPSASSERDNAPLTLRVAVEQLPELLEVGRGFGEPAGRESVRAASVANFSDEILEFPLAGEEFAGFRLGRELGRGAFGRVFLAHQHDLSDRPVVLKVSADIKIEARALARLLHPNIVPIYSIHKSGSLMVVCMPFCGSTTLADALGRFRDETLPDSGRRLVTLLNTSAVAPSVADALPELPPLEHHAASTTTLELLQGMSYVDSVLWIGARLADALAHAHERGILHRDLKPANILLTDEGQPMLLDFNLAVETNAQGIAERARMGGTLPYMAPEQKEQFLGRPVVLDARTDVYALGVILFELLTGRWPFPLFVSATHACLDRMLKDRHRPLPAMRPMNPAITPAVESIVHKCLQPDPARRYQSAKDLEDDLQRQLAHQPLKFAAEPSPRESLRKWARRHPRLSSSAFLGTCAAVMIGLALGLILYQRDQRLGAEAGSELRAFEDDSRRFQLSLTGLPGDDRRALDKALEAGTRTLARYPESGTPAWTESAAVRYLRKIDRERLRDESGALLLMLAHAAGRTGDDAEALRLNTRALASFAAGAHPPALWSQRAELLQRLGRADEAAEAKQRGGAPVRTARDNYLAAWEHARVGRYAPAVPLLEVALQLDPSAVWAWFLLGRCHDGLGRDASAVACYGTCLALTPDAHAAWFNRGLANLRSGRFGEAEFDFTRVTELRADLADAYFNLGLARQARRDHAGAVEDFGHALDRGAAYTRVYFARATSRSQLKDIEGAAAIASKA